jgi:protein TonB
MKPLAKTLTYPAPFEEILFLNKNKEYGAYVLRKSYTKNLITAFFIGTTFFSLLVSSPLYIKNAEPAISRQTSVNHGEFTFKKFEIIPSVEKSNKPTGKVVKEPTGNTVKFTKLVVEPDNKVTTDGSPSKEQFINATSSTVTSTGNGGGEIDPNANNTIVEPVQEPVKEEPKPETEIRWAEEMPSYPGGQDALYSVISSNINYPDIAKRAGIIGKVLLSFVIEKDGSVSNIRIERGIGGGCDEEAIKAVSKLDKWNPGIQNGRPVRVRMMIPIFFRLS